MNESAGHVHAEPRLSEAEALAAISPHITGIKRRIVEQAGAAGDNGVIPDEFEGLINTVRRRFTDLWKEGTIKPTDRTRKNKRGNNETVFVLGRDENARGNSRVKPVEADVIYFDGVGGPSDFDRKQKMRVTVEISREDWERVPSPARVRFI